MLSFPFETITNAADRAAVMKRVLDFFHAKLAYSKPLTTIEADVRRGFLRP